LNGWVLNQERGIEATVIKKVGYHYLPDRKLSSNINDNFNDDFDDLIVINPVFQHRNSYNTVRYPNNPSDFSSPSPSNLKNNFALNSPLR
jgi:hypothetical protein